MAESSQPTQRPSRGSVDGHKFLVQPRTIDHLVGPDHLVRLVWEIVCRWSSTASLRRSRHVVHAPAAPHPSFAC